MQEDTVLQIRRLAPQVHRLEDAPAEIVGALAAISALGLTHSRSRALSMSVGASPQVVAGGADQRAKAR